MTKKKLKLQFKDYRRGEFKRIYGDTKCFAGCDAPDSLKHVMTCNRYDTRFTNRGWDEDEGVRKQFIQYLKELDLERTVKYGLPVLYKEH